MTTNPPVIEIGKLFDREPPCALEMEVCLLGSVVLSPAVLDDVLAVVPSGRLFYGANYGDLYDVMVRLWRKYRALDRLVFLDACRSACRGKLLDRVGGEAGILHIAEAVPTAVNAPTYARIVREKWLLRCVAEIAGEMLYDVYLAPDRLAETEVEDLMARWTEQLVTLRTRGEWDQDARVRTRLRQDQLPGAGVGVSAELEALRAMSGAKKKS